MHNSSGSGVSRVILLDTSLQGALIGLAVGQDASWQLHTGTHYESPQEAAAALPRMFDEILQKAACQLADISAVIVGVGPGSFTGIKIGLSFAYGLKRSLPSLELHGLSALRSLQRSSDDLWLLPATQTAGYFAWKQAGKMQLGIVQGPDLAGAPTVQDWKLILRQDESGEESPLELAWPKAAKILGSWPRLEAQLKEKSIGTETSCHSIGSISTSILDGMLEDYLGSSEVSSPQPLYLRRSAPEEKLASQTSRS